MCNLGLVQNEQSLNSTTNMLHAIRAALYLSVHSYYAHDAASRRALTQLSSELLQSLLCVQEAHGYDQM